MSKILRGLNEVNAQNYDSDIDYYNALNRKPRGRSEDDYVEPEDPYQDLYRKQDAEMAKYKKEVNVQYVNKEGSAPNGERYNGAFIVRAKTPYQGDNEIYKFNDAHWGAKKIVDTVKKQPDEQGEPYTTIVYYVDNHKHGYWKPWKDEPPISKGVEFTEEIMREGISQEDLADLLFHRLELRYPDVVQRYGHEVVGDIVLDVAGFHEGAEELGTSDIGIMLRQIMRKLEEYANEQINELSPQTLASYKQKAGADASAADKRGDFARGNKRFSGIVRATKKEFDNDAKGIKESQTEGEATLSQIARAGDDGYEMIEDGLDGLLGTEAQIMLQDMYNDVSIEHRLHPDDDFEQIFDRMMDRIEQDYGVNESYFDRGDYYNARVGGEYGKGLTPQELGSAHYVSHGDGPKGRPAKVRGVSNKLPADPFGRTSGAVPRDIGVGKIHRIAGPGDEIDEACWKGYHKEGNKKMFGKTYPNCVKNTNEEEQLDEKCWDTHKQVGMKNKGGKQVPNCVPKESIEEGHEQCPECGGPMFSELLINEKKDACYYKVKSRYKVWPSAYASGALVKCRKKGASNWGTGGKKNESTEELDENLHKWFKEKWVRFGPDGKIRGDCARGDDSEGKPKCLPQSKAHSLGKKGRASAAARKRREDPNPERSGKAINVNTKKKSNENMVMGVSSDASSAGSRVQGEGTQQMGVGSKVYHPIHGSGKVVKHSTGAGADHWAEVKFVSGDTKKVNRKHLKLEKEQGVTEAEKNPHTSAIGKALYRALSKQPKLSPQRVQLNKERWAQRQKEREQGNDDMRMDEINEDWQKVNKKDKTDGMSRKAVKAYRRENPGSKLKTAVTTKPSKLKKGSKAAKRRKSFCARMSGMKKAHASAKTKRDPDSPINKALRRWNCESVEQLHELMMIAEQKVQALREAANPAQQAAIAVNMKKKGQKPKSESAIEKGIVDENLGLPNPGTYEQETASIKRKGQQERVQSIAFESKK